MVFYKKLDVWFEEFGRSLPWRGIDDAYRIWLSEIILQQTRIEQGRGYYERFVEAFPTVEALAAASEEQVLRLWQGLGYYSRARNLHKAAQSVVSEWGGRFPTTVEGLLTLKGVGRYTAAAVASFAYGVPVPVIDGNVYRFISRLYGISTPVATDAAYTEFEALLKPLISRAVPARFNAAMMDFGALQCRPEPDCEGCPFVADCVAFRSGRVAMLPVRVPKSKPAHRYFLYYHICWAGEDGEYTLMAPREGKDIWRGLWQFPLQETSRELARDEAMNEAKTYVESHCGVPITSVAEPKVYVHQLTHRTIHAQFIRVDLQCSPALPVEYYKPIASTQIKDIPVSRLIDKYLHGL